MLLFLFLNVKFDHFLLIRRQFQIFESRKNRVFSLLFFGNSRAAPYYYLG
jgi:hypothetical protein